MDLFLKWINKLFSEKNKVTEQCLKLQIQKHIYKLKQYKFVLSFKVSFSLFSHEHKESLFISFV